MDDLLIFTPTKKVHMAKLEDLLKPLLKNGLKISPRKCKLFFYRITIYEEYHIYKQQKGVHQTTKKQN